MVPCRLAAILVVSLACVPAVAAQRYATLHGRVLDTSEGGIGDAEVAVVSQQTGFRRTAWSEVGGAYAVGSLDPGLYKLTVRKDGFRTLVQFNVALNAGGATALDFVLPVGSTQETITVEGTPPLIEREDAATGSSFHHQEIERLPLNGGGLLNLLEALPGTNITPATRGEAGQFTTGGQRPNANYFMVDGVSANDGVTAGGLPAQSTGGTLPPVSAFGSLDSLIPLESVLDLTVKTCPPARRWGACRERRWRSPAGPAPTAFTAGRHTAGATRRWRPTIGLRTRPRWVVGNCGWTTSARPWADP